MTTPEQLADSLRAAATELGFQLVGIAPAARPGTLEHLHRWLDAGCHGEMGYMSRRREAYANPQSVLQGVRSVIMLGAAYQPPSKEGARGPLVAAYAQGAADYHDVLRQRANQLAAQLHAWSPGCRTRIAVDTAPLLERDFARQSGLGWFGKNTMLINKGIGSYFFITALLTDLELPPDTPHEAQHCGTCTRCLDVCPTQALPEPHVLDARRCISYLTIELRNSPIAAELREGVGEWMFGCDLCQQVCPWNRKAPEPVVEEFALPPAWGKLTPVEWLTASEEQLATLLKGTPLERTGRTALLRNLAITLGNRGKVEDLPAIRLAMSDSASLVRGAAAWALGRFPAELVAHHLQAQLAREQDADVRGELNAAILRSAESAKASQPREGDFPGTSSF